MNVLSGSFCFATKSQILVSSHPWINSSSVEDEPIKLDRLKLQQKLLGVRASFCECKKLRKTSKNAADTAKKNKTTIELDVSQGELSQFSITSAISRKKKDCKKHTKRKKIETLTKIQKLDKSTIYDINSQ